MQKDGRTQRRDEAIRRFLLPLWTWLIGPEDICYCTVYVCIRPYTYTYTCVCVCIYIYIYIHTHTYTYTCVCVYIYIYIYTHIYTHTHTHAHIFAYMHIQNVRQWISSYVFGGLILYILLHTIYIYIYVSEQFATSVFRSEEQVAFQSHIPQDVIWM